MYNTMKRQMIMVIYNKEGLITRSDDKKNIVLDFFVPSGTEELTVRYSYNPKTVEDEEAAFQLLSEATKKYDATSLNIKSLLPVKNLITLSFDECGFYRGACHRQPNEQTVIIRNQNSTPGIINREIKSGNWNVVLNVHYVGCNVNYKIEIDAKGGAV